MKRLLTLSILMVILTGVLLPSIVSAAIQVSDGPCTPEQIAAGGGTAQGKCVVLGNTNETGLTKIPEVISNTLVGPLFEAIGYALMTVSAFILTLVGGLFDIIIKFSIIDMAQNIGNPQGVGGSITEAWATLRDIANMCFIFVLLFAAFKAMFSLNFGSIGTTIRNIIIVALLINFSLFFTKVVIDASNIVAVGFYKSITTANISAVGGGAAATDGQKTISSGYMRLLGLQSWHSTNIFKAGMKPQQILIVGIMSSVFMLVTAVVFLITSIMFLARFIILIFLMILSPLALIAIIIPGQSGRFNTWKDAVINQSFFAPLFFALTWVVFKVASTPGFLGQLGAGSEDIDYSTLITNAPSTSIVLVLNYVFILGLATAALVFSKQMAMKTAYFGDITKGIGAGAIGTTAWAGRNTFGKGARAATQSEWLRNKASEKGWGGMLARGGLWTANKSSKASYDLRAADTLTKVPGLGKEFSSLGKASGKGGFSKTLDDRGKAKADYAKNLYGQTAGEKETKAAADETARKYGEARKPEEEKIKADRNRARQEAVKAREEAAKIFEEKANRVKELKDNELAGIAVNPNEKVVANKELEEAQTKLKTVTETHRIAIEKEKAKIEDVEYSEKVRALKEEASGRKTAWDKIKDDARNRQEAYANRVEKGFMGTASEVVKTGSAGGIVGGTVGLALGGPIGAAIGGSVGAIAGGMGGSRNGSRKVISSKIREVAQGKDKKSKKEIKKLLEDEGFLEKEDEEEKPQVEESKAV